MGAAVGLGVNSTELNKLRTCLYSVDVSGAEWVLNNIDFCGRLSDLLYSVSAGNAKSLYAAAIIMFRRCTAQNSKLFPAAVMSLEGSLALRYDRAAVLFARGVYNGYLPYSPERAFTEMWNVCGRASPGRLFGEAEAILGVFLSKGFGCNQNDAHAGRMFEAAAMFGQ